MVGCRALRFGLTAGVPRFSGGRKTRAGAKQSSSEHQRQCSRSFPLVTADFSRSVPRRGVPGWRGREPGTGGLGRQAASRAQARRRRGSSSARCRRRSHLPSSCARRGWRGRSLSRYLPSSSAFPPRRLCDGTLPSASLATRSLSRGLDCSPVKECFRLATGRAVRCGPGNEKAERRQSALGLAGSGLPRPGADGDEVAHHRPATAPVATMRAGLKGGSPAGGTLRPDPPGPAPPTASRHQGTGLIFFLRHSAVPRQFQNYVLETACAPTSTPA